MPPTNPQSPQIPDAVRALKRIEKRPLAGQPGVPVPPTGGETKPKMLFNLIPWSGRTGMMFKALFALVGLVFLCIIVLFMMMLGSIDTSVFKLSLVGTVVNADNKPISDAVVKLDTEETKTDQDGKFQFDGLEIQKYHLLIQADGVEDLKEDVTMTRGFLNYTTYRTFQMNTAGDGSIIGKFSTSDLSYKFLDDKVTAGGKETKINPDGTFELLGLKTGDITFKFESANYKDVEQEFKLEPGKNDRGIIDLTAAGDITASVKSWIKEDIVSDLNVTVEGVPQDQVVIDADGNLTVKDLEAGKTYKLRAAWPGYQTRDYSVDLKQGANQIFNFRVVETGKIPFLRQVGGEYQLFVAEYDGTNTKQVTTGRTEPYGEYISGDNIYYMSTRDSLSSTISGYVYLVYAVNATTGNPQRVTTNTKDLGRIVPNLAAGKLANVTTGSDPDTRKLEVMGLDGNNRVTIKSLPAGGVFNSVAISDNGKYVAFYAQDKTKTANGLYRADTASGNSVFILNKANLQIYSISADGDKILYTATNDTTKLQDLFLYSVTSGQDTTIRTAYKGSQYQFVKGSTTQLLFQDTRDGVNNMYMLDLIKNTETALTKFSKDEGMEAIYQIGSLIVYQSNKGLYLMDPTKPHPGKLVTSSFARYTGYDF